MLTCIIVDSKRRMLMAAVRLFRRQGYERTSMLDVVRESGGPRGSLYHHFPGGKTDMAEQAIALATEAVLGWIRAANANTRSAGAFFEALGGGYARALEESGFEEGCPLATVALETSPTVPELSAACGAGLDAWVEAVAEALVAKGLPRRRAKDLGVLSVSAIEGALLLARTSGSTEPPRKVVRQLKAMVQAD